MAPKGSGKKQERLVTPVRVVALVVTAVALYLLFPSITATLSEFPELRELSPWWMIVSGLSEIMSFVCAWLLLGLSLRTTKWFAVSTAQLASNALGQAVPAGAAAGATLQYRMLKGAGIDTARTGSGMAAATALQYGTLFAMPAIALPLIAGSAAADSLVTAAWLGLGAFVIVIVLFAWILFDDRAPRLIGRALQAVINLGKRVLRRPGPRLTHLPERVTDERDLVRRELGEHWRPALSYAAGNWLFDYGALLAALAAVGSEPDPALVLLAYTASAILRMIPITPGGLGFVEAGLTGALTLSGVSSGNAVLATLQYRLVGYWLPLLGGPVAYVLYRRRFRESPA